MLHSPAIQAKTNSKPHCQTQSRDWRWPEDQSSRAAAKSPSKLGAVSQDTFTSESSPCPFGQHLLKPHCQHKKIPVSCEGINSQLKQHELPKVPDTFVSLETKSKEPPPVKTKPPAKKTPPPVPAKPKTKPSQSVPQITTIKEEELSSDDERYETIPEYLPLEPQSLKPLHPNVLSLLPEGKNNDS